MFNKALGTVSLCLGFYLSSFGQSSTLQPNVQLSEEIEASKRETLADIVGYDKLGYYVLKNQNGTLMIEQFDKQLKIMNSAELELGDGSKEREFEYIIQLQNKLWLFSSINEKKSRKNVLYAQVIDKKTLQPESSLKKMAEMDYDRKKNDGSYHVKLSQDSSAVLIFYNLPYDKGSPEQFGFTVCDKNLTLLWQKDVALPYNDELLDIQKFTLDAKGNVYLLSKLYQGKAKEKRRGLPNFEYRILSYTALGNATKEYKISLKDKFITDAQIAIRDNGEIICSGFYSEQGTYSIKGAYYLTLDGGSKAIVKQSLQEFSKDFLTEFMSESKANKGRELYEYDLDNLILNKDGGAVLVAEQYYHYVVTTYSGFGQNRTAVQTHYYNYNDIIVVSINADGRIAWTKKIPKQQHSANDGGFYSSYTLSKINNKLYFVFNDAISNLDNESDDRTANFNARGKGSAVVLVEIDKKGNMQKLPLFSTKDAEIITRPKVCEQVSENEIILYGQKRKTHKFAKVTI